MSGHLNRHSAKSTKPDTPRKSKFTEVFDEPIPSELLNHPLSQPPPQPSPSAFIAPDLNMNSRPSSRGDTPGPSGSRPGSKAGSQPHNESIDSRIESPAGIFGSPEISRLSDISEFRSPIASYFSPDLNLPGEQSLQPAQSSERNMGIEEARPISSPQTVSQNHRELVDSRISSPAGYFCQDFNLSGPQFLEKVQDQCEKMDDIKARYEDLWLSTQLFWDLMLRMQPNCVTSDPGVLRQAVDLMLDVVVGRMLPQLRPEYHPVLAESHLQALNRRLRVLELRLRTDMVTCGKSPNMLCGCIIPLKRPNNKNKLWTRHLTISKDERGGSEDRGFRFRDLAGLLRLEDFITHVYGEFLPQLSPGSPAADCGIIHTAIALMEDEIKRFLPKKDYHTADELRAEWIYVLCHWDFRAAVVLEVMGIVTDAVAFSKKDGTQIHREECELWIPETADLNRGMSPLHPSYWRRDSKSSVKSSVSRGRKD